MECKYFQKSKLLKRVSGIKGYCTLYKIDIKEHKRMCYYPYVCCKGINGEEVKCRDIELRCNDK
jgi:hypothetical protein